MNDFEERMVSKIDRKIDLTEDEISKLVYEYNIYNEGREEHRWDRIIFTVVELCERTFGIKWRRGLTESQENSFENQPYEVIKRTYQKTITVTDWVDIKLLKT